MGTEGEVMDASGASVTDEQTGVHCSPQRDAIYEPEKTGRHTAHRDGRVPSPVAHPTPPHPTVTFPSTEQTQIPPDPRF